MSKTRLFFVVDTPETNCEIFDTLEEAREYKETLGKKGRNWIAIVKNSYRENGGWNYDDDIDTFNFIKEVV